MGLPNKREIGETSLTMNREKKCHVIIDSILFLFFTDLNEVSFLRNGKPETSINTIF
jgi:hypothetical protein